MGKRYYARLAADNIRKNSKIYIPYIITGIMTAAMLYIIKSLSLNPDYVNLKRGSRSLPEIMRFGSYVTQLFAFIFLFYSNSFIMKRRRREIGLLNILGMEKRHIARLLLIESSYITLMTLIVGLGIGVLLDKLMFLSLTKMIGESVTFGFRISPMALLVTAAFMLGTYFIIYLNMLRQIHLSKPVELLAGSSVGEKEPRTKVISAFLGLALLAVGYTVSIVTEEPTKVLSLFLLAVVCVIIGTYFLFYAGSTALLKFLRSRRRFYYKPNHFIAVSGLIYRMKRNAVGLASVCILSTMVLVMVSTTTSLLVGMEQQVNKMHPYDVSARLFGTDNADRFEALCREKAGVGDSSRSTEAVIDMKGSFEAPEPLSAEDYHYDIDTERWAMNDSAAGECFPITLTHLSYIKIYSYDEEDFLTQFTENSGGGVTVIAGDPEFRPESIRLFGQELKVGKTVCVSSGARGYEIVFNTREELLGLFSHFDEITKRQHFCVEYFMFNYADQSSTEACDEAFDEIFAEDYDWEAYGNVWYTFKNDERGQALSMYGGLFFLGLFLGTLFLMDTVLIIYYKQVSEGYEDSRRFEIMQQVGMSRSEVRRSIRSQILIVFFLPLIMAGSHVAFAFPLIRRLLALLEMTDTSLYALCVLICFAGFALLYGLIYLVTARTYYKIVKR